MSADIRTYLIERFRADAETLRQRADSISKAPKLGPGPDPTMSRRMADACDDVAGLAQLLPETAPLGDILVALHQMLPELSRRADNAELNSAPAVRSVYAGAATRVQELIAAESTNASAVNGDDNIEHEIIDSDDIDDAYTDIADAGEFTDEEAENDDEDAHE